MCLSWFYVVPFLMFHHCVIFCVCRQRPSLTCSHFYTYYLLLLNWFLFFLLFLLLSVFFRLLGIRRTILRHLGCFRRNVFNGFDPKLVCNIARPIYSHKRSVKVRKMFTVFFFFGPSTKNCCSIATKAPTKPIVPPIVGVKQEKLFNRHTKPPINQITSQTSEYAEKYQKVRYRPENLNEFGLSKNDSHDDGRLENDRN